MGEFVSCSPTSPHGAEKSASSKGAGTLGVPRRPCPIPDVSRGDATARGACLLLCGSAALGAPRAKIKRRAPWTLLAVLVPGLLFALGLWLFKGDPRYAWLTEFSRYPWEFWVMAACGLPATCAGIADWRFHRSRQAVIGAKEHRSELLALAGGGLPLFVLMAWASLLAAPQWLLTPILVVVLFTVVLICYDEFVFHRKRCGRYEMFLHRVLVFGNGVAWLAWMNWCFVRGGAHG